MSNITPDTTQMRSLMSGSSGRNFTQSSPRTRKRNPNPDRISAVIIMARVSTSFTAGQKQTILVHKEWKRGQVMCSDPLGTFFLAFSFFQLPLGVIPDWGKEHASNYLSLSRTDTLLVYTQVFPPLVETPLTLTYQDARRRWSHTHHKFGSHQKRLWHIPTTGHGILYSPVDWGDKEDRKLKYPPTQQVVILALQQKSWSSYNDGNQSV